MKKMLNKKCPYCHTEFLYEYDVAEWSIEDVQLMYEDKARPCDKCDGRQSIIQYKGEKNEFNK
jgi:hypothetical protein